MKRRKDNERRRQGQHKGQAQTWTDKDKTDKSVRMEPAIQAGI